MQAKKFSIWLVVFFPFVDFQDSVGGKGFFLKSVDRFSQEFSAGDEQVAFAPFEQDAVSFLGFAYDVHLGVLRKHAPDVEIMRSVVVIVLGGHPVLEGNRMIPDDRIEGQHSLSIPALTQGPLGNVDVVCSPVGHLSSRVLVPPTKLVMTTFLDVVDFGGLTQPGIPVDVGGRVGFFEGSALGSAPDVTGYLLNFPDSAFPDDSDCGKKFLAHFASLLGTYLENPSGFLGHLGDLLAFLNGQCEWLFAINVLACLHRMDCDSRVPMVRRTNGYEVNVLRLQNLSVVLVTLALPWARDLLTRSILCVSKSHTATRSDSLRALLATPAPRPPTPMAAKRRRHAGCSLRHSQGKGNRKRRKFRQGPFGRIGSESDDGKGLIYSWILSFEEYACFHQPSFTVFFVLFYGGWVRQYERSLRYLWPFHSISTLFILGFSCLSSVTALGVDDHAKIEFFEEKIRPVLARNCYECHSAKAKKLKADSYLDRKAGWAKGGESGPALTPGKPAESLLLSAIRYEDNDLRMPPDKKLSKEVVADFEKWIAMGPRSQGRTH